MVIYSINNFLNLKPTKPSNILNTFHYYDIENNGIHVSPKRMTAINKNVTTTLNSKIKPFKYSEMQQRFNTL